MIVWIRCVTPQDVQITNSMSDSGKTPLGHSKKYLLKWLLRRSATALLSLLQVVFIRVGMQVFYKLESFSSSSSVTNTLNNAYEVFIELSSKDHRRIPHLDQTGCTNNKQGRCPPSLGGIKPQAQSSTSSLRVMQGTLQIVLKSDAQGKECSGLNCFVLMLTTSFG